MKHFFLLIALSTISFLSCNAKKDIMHIRQAVIPAAGLGTRFLPWTKAIPKELLPLLNRPALEYIFQEGVDHEVNNFCIVISPEKEIIKDHINQEHLLFAQLESKGKAHLLSAHQKLFEKIQFQFAYQENPLGLGHAILQAEPFITDPFFYVMLPDDIFMPHSPLTAMRKLAEEYGAGVIVVQKVKPEETSSYGIIAIDRPCTQDSFFIKHIVEKPAPADAPSLYAISGRYLLPQFVFEMLRKIRPGSGGELQLTDALELLLQADIPLIALVHEDNRFDIGTPSGWLKANQFVMQKS